MKRYIISLFVVSVIFAISLVGCKKTTTKMINIPPKNILLGEKNFEIKLKYGSLDDKDNIDLGKFHNDLCRRFTQIVGTDTINSFNEFKEKVILAIDIETSENYGFQLENTEELINLSIQALNDLENYYSILKYDTSQNNMTNFVNLLKEKGLISEIEKSKLINEIFAEIYPIVENIDIDNQTKYELIHNKIMDFISEDNLTQTLINYLQVIDKSTEYWLIENGATQAEITNIFFGIYDAIIGTGVGFVSGPIGGTIVGMLMSESLEWTFQNMQQN